MSAEGVSDVPAADPDDVAQRPASNLLLAGTGLSLAIAVSAVVGLSPTVSGPASPPGASQIPTDRVAVDLATPETSPLAADRTGVGGVTIEQVAAPSAGPPPAALAAANSGSLPAGSPSAAAAPQPPGVSFAPADSKSPIAASNPAEPDSSTAEVDSGDTVTGVFGAFGDGGTELGGAPSPARSGAAGPGIGAGGGLAKAGNSTGGAGGGGGNEFDGNSNAGNAAGSSGDDLGDSDGQGDHGGGQGGHGGHGGHHGR